VLIRLLSQRSDDCCGGLVNGTSVMGVVFAPRDEVLCALLLDHRLLSVAIS
jgi:hypothetical protein